MKRLMILFTAVLIASCTPALITQEHSFNRFYGWDNNNDGKIDIFVIEFCRGDWLERILFYNYNGGEYIARLERKPGSAWRWYDKENEYITGFLNQQAWKHIWHPYVVGASTISIKPDTLYAWRGHWPRD